MKEQPFLWSSLWKRAKSDPCDFLEHLANLESDLIMKDKNTSTCTKTTIGGQALIEGIMMKGPRKIATVVRRPDGTHAVREQSYKPLKEKSFLFGLPFIRGVFVFGSTLSSGVSEIMFSANEAEPSADVPKSKFDLWLEKKLGAQRADKIFTGIALFFGIVLPIGLFILLPSFLASLLPISEHSSWLTNLYESLFRLLIFFGFIFITSKQKDMRRVYGYHGAEHKSIFCYESGYPLTVENVRSHSRFHPRCGTSFLFIVVMLSILIFSLVPVGNIWLRLLIRLALLPILVNISYEVTRIVGRYDNLLTRALRAPGLWLQRITTNEPDDDMIAVAIDALERVIPENKGEDKW